MNKHDMNIYRQALREFEKAWSEYIQDQHSYSYNEYMATMKSFMKQHIKALEEGQSENDVVIEINRAAVEESIDYYGENPQLVVVMEECCELAQATSKYIRKKDNFVSEYEKAELQEHVAEEIADVMIAIELLKQICIVTNKEIQEWINLKQDRTMSRIAAGRTKDMKNKFVDVK